MLDRADRICLGAPLQNYFFVVVFHGNSFCSLPINDGRGPVVAKELFVPVCVPPK